MTECAVGTRKGVSESTEEWTHKILKILSFKQPEVKVYFLLTQENNQKAEEIAKTLKMHRRQVYRSLKTLQVRGVVNASSGRATKFSAASFEKVLEAFRKEDIEEAKRIEYNKSKLIIIWQSLMKGTDEKRGT